MIYTSREKLTVVELLIKQDKISFNELESILKEKLANMIYEKRNRV